MTISPLIRASALILLATGASAQAADAPATITLAGATIGDVVAPEAGVAPGRFGGSNMLAALARVEPGLYTDNEMIRIQQARSSGDTGTLRFYLSHDNRVNAGEPTAPRTPPTYSPVEPMGGRGPNG